MNNGNGTLIERKAFIFNVQKYNMYDGPGIRTLIFFQGCPLRCKWCANPEGLERKYQVLFKSSLCKNCGACVQACPVGIHVMSGMSREHEVIRNIECTGCRKCEKACPASALSIAGEVKKISELFKIVEEDRNFYNSSGGGVTLGGGEALMQPEAAMNLLMVCRHEGINTAVETSGYAKQEVLLKVAEFTDLFLYDIKHIDPVRHMEFTGVRNELILGNLKELLQRRYNVKIRIPLMKNINDSRDDIMGLIDFMTPFRDYKNFKGIDLLPYHKMGVNKYKQLGMRYLIEKELTLSSSELESIESLIKVHGINVTVVRH